MINIDKALVSLDVVEEYFMCDLKKCKGACCVEGQSGAPLLQEETVILEQIYPVVKNYIQKEGVEAIEKQGVFVIDADRDKVTPLIEGKECAYAVFDDEGIAKCGIEKAWKEGKVKFRKPLSCHLYPIRITNLKEYEAVNYERWHVCKPAIRLGQEKKSNVYLFLKDALIRKYGKEWYSKLRSISKEYNSQKRK